MRIWLKPLHLIPTYAQLQNELDSEPTTERVLVIGDTNAKKGNDVKGVKSRFDNCIANDHGQLLIKIYVHNKLRLNDIFFFK